MKSRLALSCAVLLTAAFVYAQEPPSSSTPSQDRDRSSQPTAMSSKSTRLVAEVVSTDSTAKTITVRNATSAESSPSRSSAPGSAGMTSDTMTFSVDSKAIASLKSFNAGDRVSLTCAKDKAGSYGSSGSSAAGASGATGTAGTAGTAGTPGSTGNPGSASGDFSKMQASCPSVTAIAKVKAPSSSEKP